MKTKRKTQSAAVLTIRRAADMTPEGRERIAKWLRKMATFLLQHGSEMSDGFRATYGYVDDDAEAGKEGR